MKSKREKKIIVAKLRRGMPATIILEPNFENRRLIKNVGVTEFHQLMVGRTVNMVTWVHKSQGWDEDHMTVQLI